MNAYEQAVKGAIEYYTQTGKSPNRLRAHPLVVRQLKHDVAPELIGFNAQNLRKFLIVCAVGELVVEPDIAISLGEIHVDRVVDGTA